MAQQRNIGKPAKTGFKERLVEEARRFKDAAEREQPGSLARELLLKRALQAEAAADISQWLSQPSQQASK